MGIALLRDLDYFSLSSYADCVDTVSARTMQRFASSTLNPFSLAGCASFSAASAALRKVAAIRGVALQLMLGLARTPGNRTHTAQSNTRMLDPAAIHLDDDRCRGQRELVGSAIAQLQVMRSSAGNGARQRDTDDQVARLQNILAVRVSSPA